LRAATIRGAFWAGVIAVVGVIVVVAGVIVAVVIIGVVVGVVVVMMRSPILSSS